MEVFIFMSSADEMQLVEQTLIAWEPIEYAFPINVVQVKEHRFEIERRVLADHMAHDSHYVIADIGCVPSEPRALLGIMGGIKSKAGMVGFGDEVPSGIRLCRKGVIKRWPAQETDTYDLEHYQAVISAGYEVTKWPTTYKRILAC